MADQLDILTLSHEVAQDGIRRPHIVNPVIDIVDSGDATHTIHYNAAWGLAGYRCLLVFVGHAPVVPATPTFDGVAMIPVGHPVVGGGLWWLPSPASSGDLVVSAYTGTPGAQTTVMVATMTGVAQLPPAFSAAHAGTWDSSGDLEIVQAHGTHHAVLTFLETSAAHGEISADDHYVQRIGGSSDDRLLLAVHGRTGPPDDHTVTFQASASATGPYRAWSVALHGIPASPGTQREFIRHEHRMFESPSTSRAAEDAALARLPSQFDDSPRLLGVVAAVASAVDCMLVNARDMPRYTELCAAQGRHLDEWGLRHGFPRPADENERMGDLVYRRILLARILAWHSTGTYPDLRAISRILFPDSIPHFSMPAPATARLTVDEPVSALAVEGILDTLRLATSRTVVAWEFDVYVSPVGPHDHWVLDVSLLDTETILH